MTPRGLIFTERLPDIFYEDPEPIEDGMLQEPTIYFLVHLLREWFEGSPDTFISADGFIFYNRANGNDRIAPDIYIALGVDPHFIYQFPNYFIWEVGKPPDFVIEVASPSTASNDLGPKRALYARLGIPEYWRMDRTGGDLYGEPLIGERLVNGEYVPYNLNHEADGTVWARSEVLSLDFYWDGERFDIRDPLTGQTINPKVKAERDRMARREVEDRAAREAAARREAEDRAAREAAARREAEDRAAQEGAARREAEAEVRRLRNLFGESYNEDESKL